MLSFAIRPCGKRLSVIEEVLASASGEGNKLFLTWHPCWLLSTTGNCLNAQSGGDSKARDLGAALRPPLGRPCFGTIGQDWPGSMRHGSPLPFSVPTGRAKGSSLLFQCLWSHASASSSGFIWLHLAVKSIKKCVGLRRVSGEFFGSSEGTGQGV